MKNFLIAFIVFLVWSFFGLWLYSWFQNDDNTALSKTELVESSNPNNSYISEDKVITKNNDSEVKEVKEEEPQVLDSNSELDIAEYKNEIKTTGLRATNTKGDIIFIFNEGISIAQNSSEVFVPESIRSFKIKTKAYLLEHPDNEVQINSLYGASENFESPNLGVKRAEKIRKILTEIGVPKEKIVIKPIIKGIEFNKEGYFNNSISIIFKPLDTARVEGIRTRLFDNRILYPRFSNSGILINDNLKNLLSDIKQIVKDNPEIRVELIGHTDNIGNDLDNYEMGLYHANQIQWYLVTNGGIEKSMIKSTSKGESEPIDTNDTESGRIANRRIEVIFY
jgi:outer membrane protein OmpA-like peptidoglycan-associated protein